MVPVFRLTDEGRWGTAQWRPRRRHLFLTPGTSPMGLRLPLSSLAWGEAPDEIERSALEMTGLLPIIVEGEAPPAVVQDIADAPRSALCVEEREGRLYVFLPPLTKLEDALELLSVVETAASAVELPVVLEGYPLPFDLRTKTLSVTPDPGVIEVNTQPTSSWAEQRDLTLSLYEDARQTRLATEKFDLDGTHTGTGGGNHFTLGGATPADSPLLRRPDLLRSLLTYWQHHPALSYVFSGRFIGPTSQAPRVDEGRHETLYELEIAFAELDRVTADADAFRPPDEVGELPALPWNTDRLLRHLLTDLTGNTHRSEFCIDKLYSPDSQRGRLGLLELRGFEMPPHARMALVQALLVRCLVAMFWARPYRGRLIRWGTRLHDRFLLPAFAAADLREVVGDINEWLAEAAPGSRFDPAWLDPFLEFRFPRLGESEVAGVRLELRQAIEPWHVLGEEATGHRHGPLRRLVRRTSASGGFRSDRGPARGHLQRGSGAADRGRARRLGHRAGRRRRAVHGRHVRRRRPLPGLGAVVGAAPDDGRAFAAGVRPGRHLERPLAGRLHLPRGASRRSQLRHLPGQRGRGGIPPGRPVQRPGAHRRPDRHVVLAGGRGGVRPDGHRIPLHARPASLLARPREQLNSRTVSYPRLRWPPCPQR